MIEALFVLGLLGVLVLLGLTALFMSLETILIVGASLIAVGFIVGVPAGAYYHLKLYRCVAARGAVPRRFWLQPTRYHAELETGQWRGILPWFAVGGAGFVLIIVGFLVVMVGVLRA